MKLILKVLLFSFMVPFLGMGQSSDLGNWVLLFGNKKINDKLNWHHEVQYRNYNVAGDLEQLLLRTGIGYSIADNSNLLLGYGFIRSENYIDETEKIIVNEHRIFQQFITKQKIGDLRVQHRYRFEQRFVEENYRMRLRYFLALAYPLWKKEDAPNEFYLSAYNEIFLNTETTIFDRNRIYGGLGYRLNEMFRFELGFMNQVFNKGNRDQVNLVCFINW